MIAETTAKMLAGDYYEGDHLILLLSPFFGSFWVIGDPRDYYQKKELEDNSIKGYIAAVIKIRREVKP